MIEDLPSGSDITLHVKRLLYAADAGDRLPTPVDDIVVAAGLTRTDGIVISPSMISRAPKKMRPLLRSARRKILGVLDRRERVIQIKHARTAGRERFVTCHEVAHDILPWQADLAVVGDNRQSLSPQVTAMFEREANQGAAEILFQQDLLRRVARDYPIRISTPLDLATLFGASIHATFRRWVEGLDAVACGLVLDPNLTEGHRRRYEQIFTPQWQQQLRRQSFPPTMTTTQYSFVSEELREGTFHTTTRDDRSVELRYETYTTGYRHFALLWAPTRQNFIARHRKQPIISPFLRTS